MEIFLNTFITILVVLILFIDVLIAVGILLWIKDQILKNF